MYKRSKAAGGARREGTLERARTLQPPRADLVLTSAQVSQYCDKIGQFSAQSLSKLQMAEALQGKLKDSSAAFLSAIQKESQVRD